MGARRLDTSRLENLEDSPKNESEISRELIRNLEEEAEASDATPMILAT